MHTHCVICGNCSSLEGAFVCGLRLRDLLQEAVHISLSLHTTTGNVAKTPYICLPGVLLVMPCAAVIFSFLSAINKARSNCIQNEKGWSQLPDLHNQRDGKMGFEDADRNSIQNQAR